jgi:hypothetical protein
MVPAGKMWLSLQQWLRKRIESSDSVISGFIYGTPISRASLAGFCMGKTAFIFFFNSDRTGAGIQSY